MFLYSISFYLFSSIIVLSALMVISAKNPVHSVLFLILSFVSASGLFVLLGAEFLAMILVVVYVGAVAVLFLFVVMMLDINFVKLREGFLQYLPFGVLLGIVLLTLHSTTRSAAFCAARSLVHRLTGRSMRLSITKCFKL